MKSVNIISGALRFINPRQNITQVIRIFSSSELRLMLLIFQDMANKGVFLFNGGWEFVK